MATDHDLGDATQDGGSCPSHNLPPCAFLDTPFEFCAIDDCGDKILNVGTNKCNVGDDGAHEHERGTSFRVCSRALRRSSPVMKAMLFGYFRESTQDVIELPEDYSAAMMVLLFIAHNDFSSVYLIAHYDYTGMESEFIDYIYNIVALADKYQMTQLLRPWAASWASALQPLCTSRARKVDLNKDDRQDLEKILFVANEFGHATMYEEIVRQLSMHQSHNGQMFSASIEPRNASENILCARSAQIKWFLHELRHLMRLLSQEDVGLDDFNRIYSLECDHDEYDDREECELYHLGVVTKHLVRQELWPLPNISDVIESPRDLYLRIAPNALDPTTLSEEGILFPGTQHIHEGCYTRRNFTKELRDLADPGIPLCTKPSDDFASSMLSRAEQFDIASEHTLTYRKA